MSTSADRNLLFGVLALQNDLVTREQLTAGLKAWVKAKERPLADILEETGALTPKRRALLEPLVEEHIRQHADDPRQCLAAISSIGSLYDDLAQVADGQLAASLTHLGRARHAVDPYATVPPTVGQSTGQGTRFRILRRRFKGGMGEISEAEDLELKRIVALKEILPKFADDRNAQLRFTYEAEITGLLEHPGVVPVYGLGTYADGRPFYAMRFIKGSDLGTAISEFHRDDRGEALGPRQISLKLRELLGRFIDVCQAIHYAHDRGVLHRDLKPGNIMLGEYGETLVVDWGLAKVAGRKDMPATLASEAVIQPASEGLHEPTRGTLGTYDYMGPEQARHRQDLMGPTADIFSLGATLYQLLTGRAPYQGLPAEEKLKCVMDARFPRPREIKKDIPPALEAICLKAMAKEPADRYASAKDLVTDLKHCLADEPIAAWREPLSARCRRWMRRHRTLVASAATAIVAAVVILAASFVVIRRSYLREMAAHSTAQENLGLARTAVDEMLLQVGRNELADVPQMESVRAVLFKKAQDFYRKFSSQAPDDPGLALEIARARRSLGDVYRILHDRENGEDAYQKSIEHLLRLSHADPDESLYQQELATTYNWLGELLRPDDPKNAEQQYSNAKLIQDELVQHHPGKSQYKQELARSTYNLGIVCDATGRPADAIEYYDQAIELLNGALAQQPPASDAAACRQELARCYNNRGKSLKTKKLMEPAEESYARAIETLEDLQKSFPHNREYQQELAAYYNNQANLQSVKRQPQAAKQNNTLAITLLRELAEPIPSLSSELGNALQTAGTIDLALAVTTDAKVHFEEARAIFTRLAAQSPDDWKYRDRLGNALFELGKLAFSDANPDYAGARNLANQAILSHQQAYATGPDSAVVEHLASDYYLLAWCHERLLEYAQAVDAIGDYRKQFEKLRTADITVAAEILAWPDDIARHDLPAAEVDRLIETIENHALGLLRVAANHGFNDAEALRKSKADGGRFHRLHGPKLDELIQSLRTPQP